MAVNVEKPNRVVFDENKPKLRLKTYDLPSLTVIDITVETL